MKQSYPPEKYHSKANGTFSMFRSSKRNFLNAITYYSQHSSLCLNIKKLRLSLEKKSKNGGEVPK